MKNRPAIGIAGACLFFRSIVVKDHDYSVKCKNKYFSWLITFHHFAKNMDHRPDGVLFVIQR
jgi:hypothetical protein